MARYRIKFITSLVLFGAAVALFGLSLFSIYSVFTGESTVLDGMHSPRFGDTVSDNWYMIFVGSLVCGLGLLAFLKSWWVK